MRGSDFEASGGSDTLSTCKRLKVLKLQFASCVGITPDQLKPDGKVPHYRDKVVIEEEDKEIEEDEEFEDLGKKKKKKKHNKPTRPANLPAAPSITFGFPVNYTQYWMNLTEANTQKQPVYTIEYTSQDAYGMKELSVTHFLVLAQQVMKNANLKSTFLARMVAQMGTENDH
ncbi:hypothetical protein BG005_008051 [Podila minutissima]|nr:hypothetical protein BG005_008051 [Podila minutissima]